MFEDEESKGEDLPELSDDFKIDVESEANVSVFKRALMGELTTPWLSAVIDPLDQYVAGCYSNGEIKVFDPHGGDWVKTLKSESKGTKNPVTSIIKFKPNNDIGGSENVLLGGDDSGNITKYDVTDGMVVEKIEWKGEAENKIHALDYSPNGQNFAAAGLDKMVRVYDDITMKLIQELDPYKSGHSGHSNRVFWVKFNSEDPNILISGGWDNNIIIHDIREKGPVNSIIGANVCGESLDFSGNKILSGSNRTTKQLQIWDLETTKLLQNIDWNGQGMFKEQEQCKVFWSKFFKHTDTNKEYIVAGGGATNELRIFDSALEPIVSINHFSRGCFTWDTSATGDSLLCGGGDGVIRLFRIMFGVD